MYLVAVIDWHGSRLVLSWRLSNTMDKTFCVEALQDALERYGKPEIFNSDQGVQFTCEAFITTLSAQGIRIPAWTAKAAVSTTSSASACGLQPEILKRFISKPMSPSRRSQNTDRKLVHVLQRPTPSPSLELSNAASVLSLQSPVGICGQRKKERCPHPHSRLNSHNKEIHMIKDGLVHSPSPHALRVQTSFNQGAELYLKSRRSCLTNRRQRTICAQPPRMPLKG